MKVLWIAVIVLAMTVTAFGQSKREVHERNRNLTKPPRSGKARQKLYHDSKEWHTERHYFPKTRGRKRIIRYKCVDAETQKEVPCPPELVKPKKDPRERTYGD